MSTLKRPFNFSAGPATLPLAVLEQAAEELLDWRGCGMSVMEMSHRGPQFMEILHQTLTDARDFLALPPEFHILLMQGGGLAANALIPLNLLGTKGPLQKMNFVVSGYWSQKSYLEAQRYGPTHVAANNQIDNPIAIPPIDQWQLSQDPAYVHICSNETINGLEFHELPNLEEIACTAPLVADISSHMASRTIDWSRLGLAFGGAQKNLGIAGLTLIFVHEQLLGRALPSCPSVFNFQILAQHQSMLNTPPTYAIYIAGLVFQWLKQQTFEDLVGIEAVQARNIAKAQLLYECIDNSTLYQNQVETSCRSRMNVPFFLSDSRLNEPFLQKAKACGLLQLEGHKSKGGMRANLYNAMPLAGVEALVLFMNDFAKHHA